MPVRYFYVDESWDEEKFCLSAICIRHSDWHTCLKMIQGHRKLLNVDYGMFVRREIHARDLVAGRGNIAKKILSRKMRAKIFYGLLELVAAMPNVKLFNVCIESHGKKERGEGLDQTLEQDRP